MSEVLLGDLAEFVMGQAPPGENCNQVGEGMPFVKAGEFGDPRPIIREWTTTPLQCAKETDVLVCVVGATAGKINLGADCAIGRSVGAVRPRKGKLDQRFLYHYLRTQTAKLRGGSQGSAQGVITRRMLEQLPMPSLLLNEQQRIAAILDRADAIRRKRKQAIALTEQLLRSIFLEIFGDPVTNPKAWPVKPLTEACLSKQYGTAEKANEAGDGQPVLRMNNLTYAGEIDLASMKWVNLPENEASKLDLQDGDILFNRVNSHELVGKTAVWSHGEGYTFAGYLIRLRVDRDEFNPFFVGAAMNMPSMKNLLFAMAKPSINMANISGSDLVRVPIIKPPLPLQNRFQAIVDRVRIMRKSFDAASFAGNACFDSLVSRSFSTT